MNHLLTIVFLLLTVLSSFGQQNLILNGDFEEYWECPDDATQIERCKYVFNPCSSAPSTSDYFNACYTEGFGAPVGVPNTLSGYQNAQSGGGNGWICMHRRTQFSLQGVHPTFIVRTIKMRNKIFP